MSGYLVSISEIHSLIHQGKFFSSHAVDTSLEDNTSIKLLIDPNGGIPHLRVTTATGGDSRIEIFEGPTVSNNGTEIDRHNRNRLSSNTSTTVIYSGPTVSDDGTKIFDTIVPGGIGRNSSGGDGGIFEEFIFKPDTTYLVQATNLSGQTKAASVAVDFYEL